MKVVTLCLCENWLGGNALRVSLHTIYRFIFLNHVNVLISQKI